MDKKKIAELKSELDESLEDFDYEGLGSMTDKQTEKAEELAKLVFSPQEIKRYFHGSLLEAYDNVDWATVLPKN